MSRIMFGGFAFLLAACSPDNKVEEASSSSGAGSDHTSEYREAVIGIWGRCHETSNRYEEIQFTASNFTKRIVVFKPDAAQGETCKAGDELYEIRASGFYEVNDDGTEDPDFDIVYDNAEIGFVYYDHDELLSANGIAKQNYESVPPLCSLLRLNFNEYAYIKRMDWCRDPDDIDAERVTVEPFIAHGKLQVESNHLVYDPTAFLSMMVDNSQPEAAIDKSNPNLYLLRQTAVYKVDRDFGVFTEISRLKEAIQGEWRLCSDSDEVVINFGPTEYTQTITTYGNADCSGADKYYIKEFKGSYELVNYSSSIPGAFGINWYVTDQTLEPLHQAAVDFFNGTGDYSTYAPACEDVTFTLNVASNVIGKKCVRTSTGYTEYTTSTLYDLLLFHQDGSLYDSNPADWEGGSETKRVTKIDWELQYTK